MKVKCLLITFSLFFTFSGFAQEKPESENEKQIRETIFKPAEYIFEGTVLETKNYTTKEGWRFSQAIVEIHKVFRGDLKPGTVEMITCPAGYFFVKDNLPKFNPWVTISYSDSQGNCGFAVGHTDLFLGVKTKNVSPNTDCPVTNKFVIQQFDRIHYSISKEEFYSEIVAYISGGQIAGLGKAFKKLQDLYDFILETPDTKFIDFDHKVFQKLGRDGLPKKSD
jgi:hypothetical protein